MFKFLSVSFLLLFFVSCAYETKTTVRQKFSGDLYSHKREVIPVIASTMVLPAMQEEIVCTPAQYVVALETTYPTCKNCVSTMNYYIVEKSQMDSLHVGDEVEGEIFSSNQRFNMDEIIHVQNRTQYE